MISVRADRGSKKFPKKKMSKVVPQEGPGGERGDDVSNVIKGRQRELGTWYRAYGVLALKSAIKAALDVVLGRKTRGRSHPGRQGME